MPFGIKSFSQNGGDGVFRFLNIPNSAKIASLGNTFPTFNDRDISLSFQNPALIKSDDKGALALNYSNYVADINFGSVQYGFNIKDSSIISTGLMFINYGNFDETDPAGNLTGNTFTGGDYLLNIGYARNWQNKLFYGANFKMIYGSYDIYRSFALATDLSLTYRDSISNLSGGIIIRNLGTQLKAFNIKKEKLPLEISLAISQKLKYAPIRYHITYKNLQKFNLSYSDPNDPDAEVDLGSGEPINRKVSFGNKLMKHFVFGGELLLSPALNLQAGYNVQRGEELGLSGSSGMAGLSFGFSIQLKRMTIAYANSRLNVAGSNNYFSLQLQPSIFSAKK